MRPQAPGEGAREGAEFISAHIIRVTEKAFDDFAAGGTDQDANRRHAGAGAAEATAEHRRQPFPLRGEGANES
jgi:hypothetical protein